MASVVDDEPPDGRPLPGSQRSRHDRDAVVRRVRSEAKRRLARELHDSVAQALTVMVVDMEHFKLEMAGQPALVGGIDRMQQSARQVLRGLREVLYELREEPVMDSGLVQDLRVLLDRLGGGTAIRARLRVSAGWPPALSRTTSHQLCRIVEEALDNVRLHAAADQVAVELETADDHLVLRIADNGRSLRSDERRRTMRLIGMQERATLLGGRLRVTSGEERGTTVLVVFPRPAVDPAGACVAAARSG